MTVQCSPAASCPARSLLPAYRCVDRCDWGGPWKLEVGEGSGGVEGDWCPPATDYLERDRHVFRVWEGVPKLFREPERELEEEKKKMPFN